MTYTVADYLLDRLAEQGVRHMFGVPGDFTLGLLDHVEEHKFIDWVGTGNELGAGYAADGYARLSGLGVVCTTFGVGELSAVNALAGSYAEHVPVLHVVGAPSEATQQAGRATHHTLGDGDFRHFARMSAEISCTQGFLNAENAADEIDRVLRDILAARRPGYLLIPANVAEAPATRPTQILEMPTPGTNAQALANFRKSAQDILSAARSVAVLADILVQRMGVEQELNALLTTTGAPHATLLWGRRVVDESAPAYLGTYVGAVSDEPVRRAIEDSDILVSVGVHFTDLTSAFFTQDFSRTALIEVGPRGAKIGGQLYGPVGMADALGVLTELTTGFADRQPAPRRREHAHAMHLDDDLLGQESLWDEVADTLRPHDMIVADQGTSFYGMGAHRLPQDVVFIGQPLWASIGFSMPALLGASLAEPTRRPVLLIGDGAAQLTVPELGTILRNNIPGVIVVVDNNGYTVERAIHGPAAAYNDIAHWDWTQLVAAMSPDDSSVAVIAQTVGDLRRALEWSNANPDRLMLVQAIVPALDVPPLLAALADLAGNANQAPLGAQRLNVSKPMVLR